MKTLICHTLGGPETLSVEEAPDCAATEGEALIDVDYAALNFFDLLLIAGKYQVKPSPPFSPAGEFSGRIAALGPGTTGFAVGQRVCGYAVYGCARERLAIPIHDLFAVPDALGLDKAAGLSITYGTTMHAFRQRGELKAGETLVVLGASGGVGLAAVELGARMGARVIACASSVEKLAFARKMGAHETINYASDDLRGELKRLTGARGVDVVYDPVGGALTEVALRCLGWKGRLLVIGFASGEIPKPPLNLALLKGCDIRGVHWGEFVKREPQAHRANMDEIIALAARGALSAHVHASFPLDQFRAAFALIENREARGKVLLRIGA